MPDYFDGDNGVLWVQPGGAGNEVIPLICVNSPGPTTGLGDIVTRMYRDANGWHVANNGRGTPARPTMTIEAYQSKTRTWIQDQIQNQTQRNGEQCGLPIYLEQMCGRQDNFLNYESGQLLKNAIFTQVSNANMVRSTNEAGGGAAEMAMTTYEMSFDPYPISYYQIYQQLQHTITRTAAISDAAMDGQQCADCCTGRDACEDGALVSGTDTAYTDDGWVTSSTGADPFAGGSVPSVIARSVVRFESDRCTMRTLVNQGTADAVGFYIAYSDEADLSVWNEVEVSTSATEYAVHGGTLFAHDRLHIYCGTNLGNIFFSNDGGSTWTDQAAPDPIAGAQEIYCISFPLGDYNNGWACGDDNHIMKTTDGTLWSLVTGPAAKAADCATGIAAVSDMTAYVCYDDGEVYVTRDGGTSWTILTLSSEPDSLGDIKAIDEFQIVTVGVITVSASEYPVAYRSVNGGADWEQYIYTTEFDGAATYGMNSVWVCDINHWFSFGEPIGGMGSVIEYVIAGNS